MSARTPVATAMTALTLDHLSGGRFQLGLGASGPQVVEGWYGQPYPKPLARTREYVEIIRRVLAREEPLDFQGEFYQLPNRRSRHHGAGQAAQERSPTRAGRTSRSCSAPRAPRTWPWPPRSPTAGCPSSCRPSLDKHYRECLAEGFARPGARRTMDDFEIPNMVNIVVNDDIEAAADMVRMFLGFYIGGMGAKEVNFHASLFARMGYGDEVEEIQDLFLAGRKDEAIKRVPLALVEDVAMVGPLDKVREELDEKWRKTCMTTLLVNGNPDQLRLVADLVNG